MSRLLRPLRDRLDAPDAFEVDEDATAERFAEAPWLPPVLRAASERRWELALVVDAAPQMAVWREEAARLAHMLRTYGGFRDLKVYRLETGADAPEGALLRGPGKGSPPRSPRSLVDPSGRRIVLVLTDAFAPAWRRGAGHDLLRTWGRRQPVAVVHALPQRLWHLTGLFPRRMRLHATGASTANADLRWEFVDAMIDAWSAPAGGSPTRLGAPRGAVAVPVLESDPDWLGPWVRFVTGHGPRWTRLAGLIATPWAPAASADEPVEAR
ncbi:tetratricopeptide repeat protein, partial [Streptomyces sp. SID3343]|nr:tetratricopeptide repeat protein [Streptomyces sp. SID3343]